MTQLHVSPPIRYPLSLTVPGTTINLILLPVCFLAENGEMPVYHTWYQVSYYMAIRPGTKYRDFDHTWYVICLQSVRRR